ncbi:tRNA(Met) cytidine acetyltransferase TmcA [Pantoea sp. 1.19]|uniref:tRNA(Met) cytidine acetyltransferase TmcA n=1 Tax=Pantoea sp. 1.19 TaxID=1925589 RepID=UPI000948941F|nr:GNAT family N-acetyltransferase [Pantoea sp. 1.19]
MARLVTLTAAMAAAGQRRLLVLSGSPAWCAARCADWQRALAGDWFHCTPEIAARTLLGRELTHAVFHAAEGFNAEAFAALSGALRAGSWLLLCVPPWDDWPARPDADSLRWSESTTPRATPCFTAHLQQCLCADSAAIVWREGDALALPSPPAPRAWQAAAQRQQTALLQQLSHLGHGIVSLTAPRGRGKSALAGRLARRWGGRVVITAPSQAAAAVVLAWAGDAACFMAPDALLAAQAGEDPPPIAGLIIDEAAAIPTPLLQRLVAVCPRILMATTVQGYEGTGRGFLLKFCASLPAVRQCTLDAPQRWAREDPLEQFTARLLLFADPPFPVSDRPVTVQRLAADGWRREPARMASAYQLLTSAHYRTTPLDLRRMMDAPGQHFAVAHQGEQVAGALWLVEEGGLSERLARAVWAGFRRPKGNLVAQSLAAHAGWPEAATLRALRISRIAVAPGLRRRGVGRALIAEAQRAAAGRDYLSVSFGYTPALWAFWQANSFQLVRLGSQREASSGCYSAMAVKALSAEGKRLLAPISARLRATLGADGHALSADAWPFPPRCGLELDGQSWRDLASFAWGQRPLESVRAALQVLLQHSTLPLPLLRGGLRRGEESAALCQRHRLAGRRGLLQACRCECQQALAALDAARAQRWQQRLAALREDN